MGPTGDGCKKSKLTCCRDLGKRLDRIARDEDGNRVVKGVKIEDVSLA
jgi:hypothetical protein